MAGIYYHIPFCKRICSYCDFYRTTRTAQLPALIEAMCREVADNRDYLHGETIRTRYFGGGTPSLCTPEQLKRLLDTTADHFDCSEVEETTLEANPDDLNPIYLSALREIGIDRLSIGIQSFDDDCLRLMNRRHTAEQAIRVVKEAQAAGFDNLTIDLIFGVPNFGREVLLRNIDTALSLGVQHISAYLLSIEPRTRFGTMAAKGELHETPDTQCEEEFMLLHERLTEAGFEHYEISNFARSGCRARHNANYWQGVPYLGIGPAAHGFDGRSRRWNVASVERYLAGEPAEEEQLSTTDRINEYLMTRLRTTDGFSLADFEMRFGEPARKQLEQDARQEIAHERLFSTDERLFIPAQRMLVSDDIISSLFAE
ncbi:MAG: radical SAM family heme chaperone HemW [Alistipes sp.]|nr:radical SAM family heme chaperone HemW [Alistipes sp.]